MSDIGIVSNPPFFRRLLKVLRQEGWFGVIRRINVLVKSKKAKLSLWGNTLLNRKVVGSVYGIKLSANYDDLTFGYYAVGSYGYFYSKLLNDVNEEFYFLDIGANQGLYSILAAKNKFCLAVTAFEPVAKTADFFVKNVELNSVDAKINLIRKAISDTNEMVEISMSKNHSGGSTIAKGNNSFSDLTEKIFTINHEALGRLTFADDVPVYVKIDVEGHEEVVIKELFKSLLGGRIKQVFYECDEAWVSSTSIASMLVEKGFELKKIGAGNHYDVLATLKEQPNTL